MEEGRNIIEDNKIKFSLKIKWILAALLLALWSYNFSYAQENDSLRQENRYETIDFKKMDSYTRFEEFEHVRQENLPYRNNIFEMARQLFKKDERLWFPEFDDICAEAENLLKWVENEENCLLILNNLIKHLEYDIAIEKNAVCRMALIRIMSIVKDKKNILNWVENNPIELLKPNLRVWDIILTHKKLNTFDLWGAALTSFDDEFPTDFTHAQICIWLNEICDIMVRQSTTETEKWHTQWVEETSFLSYLFDFDRCNAVGCDVIVLRPNPKILQSILDFSGWQIGSPYDNRAALRQWLGLPNNSNDRYNCVEIITQWVQMSQDSNDVDWDMSLKWKIDENVIKSYNDYIRNVIIPNLRSKTFPNDFFEYPELFKIVYVCTVSK